IAEIPAKPWNLRVDRKAGTISNVVHREEQQSVMRRDRNPPAMQRVGPVAKAIFEPVRMPALRNPIRDYSNQQEQRNAGQQIERAPLHPPRFYHDARLS